MSEYRKEIEDSEIWKDIPNFIGIYQCSSFGRVKSLNRVIFDKHGFLRKVSEKLLKPNLRFGYPTVSLSKPGALKRFFIHRLVAELFIPNPNNLPQVNHKDGSRDNYSIENLEWTTQQQNIIHAIKIGSFKIRHGEQVGTSKLEESDVLKIRELYDGGNWTYKKLGKEFGVSSAQICIIIKRKAWPHI